MPTATRTKKTTATTRGTKDALGRLLMATALLAGLSIPSVAPAQHAAMADGEGEEAGEMAMVMPTDDAKAFRRVRPAVAAVQAKLADIGLFEGRVNGLYGPSTREAVAAYQKHRGLEATGWPTVATVLALLELAPERAGAYAGRLDPPPASHRKGGGEGYPMPGAPHGGGAEGTEGHEATVVGDPQPPKRLTAAGMSRMAVENTHTRAVRGARALVAGFQIALVEAGLLEGPVDGLPRGERMAAALRAYQSKKGPAPTEALDFRTALSLLGLELGRVRTELGERLALHESPVAIDDSLMRESFGRVPQLIGSGRSSAGVSGPRAANGGETSHGQAGIRPGGSTGGNAGSAGAGERGAAPDTVTLQVEMGESGEGEFTFSPDTLRLPAGRPVKLVFRNAGKVPHEFMAGREVAGGDFATDLFQGVAVEMTGGSKEMHEGGMAGHDGHGEAGGHEEAHGHGGEEAEQPSGADEGHGDGHGTMILLQPDESGSMAFTLPASKRGHWQVACFQPGHYEAGMRGVLIVE